uniref:IS1 family transposase n=1 Tax=Escherichia coli TaxID=562 RepID=UPI003F4C3801
MASVSISCPSCSATDGVVRNGKSTAGTQRYLCVLTSVQHRILGWLTPPPLHV